MNAAPKKLKIYLFFCVLMFFFLLFAVMFYSFGYKYSINDQKTIQTGAIVIKAFPKNVDIYLDGKPYQAAGAVGGLFSDFVKIEGLHPGKYNLKIEKKGYFSWEKNMEVKGGSAAEVKNVVLLQRNYGRNALLNNLKSDFKPAGIWFNKAKNKIAYIRENGNSLSLFVFDLKTKSKSLVFDGGNLSLAKEDYIFGDVVWSDDSEKIVVKIVGKKDKFWRLINTQNNKIYNLTFLFAKNEKMRYKWNFDLRGESLFYLDKETLYRFDYEKLLLEEITKNVTGFLLEDSRLYYLKTDGSMHCASYNNLSNSVNLFTIFDDLDLNSPLRIERSDDSAYLILSDLGKLYFVDEGGKARFINSAVGNAYFSNNGEKIIYSSDNEIWVYYLKEKFSQPPKEEFTNELVTRYSGNISSVFLYKDEEHIFYKEGNILKFAELDDRDRRNTFNILDLENGNVYYSKESNSLYYVENSQLIQIDLNPV